MIFLILWLWLSSTGLLDLNLAGLVDKISLPLHHLCLSRLPKTSQWLNLYGAIVCGASPPASPEKFWFQSTGLYHLLVVSGSHLIFLSQWLRPFTKRFAGKLIILSFLVFYALVCRGSPPVVRALLYIVLCMLPLRSRFGWSHSQICFLTGAALLSFFPSWAVSLSFWLSWLASMLCAWSDHLKIHPFARVTLIQTFLAPAFGLSNANLGVSIVGNWLLGPLLGKYLFGCALLATLISPLSFFCDFLWTGLVQLLGAIVHFTGSDSNFSPHVVGLLVYVCTLNFLWMGWERWRR